MRPLGCPVKGLEASRQSTRPPSERSSYVARTVEGIVITDEAAASPSRL